MVMPPWHHSRREPDQNTPPTTHYTTDEPLPLVMALLMGLQHAFAMVGGLITPPLVVTRFAICGFPFCAELEQYAISAALITSGICSLIQVSKLPIPGTKAIFGRQLFLGSGILSVMGTAFTFLPIFEIAIIQMKNDGAFFVHLVVVVLVCHDIFSLSCNRLCAVLSPRIPIINRH
jgi:uric acid-xanthine permease